MSRRMQDGEQATWRAEWTPDEALAIEQSLDMQMIEHVKDLVATLWKDNRITFEVRRLGENVLSAALEAVEHPDRKNVSLTEGASAANRQWWDQYRRQTNEF